MNNRDKTMLCVTIAGVIFIPSVIWGWKWPILVGAFFDWLPLPTGWMKGRGINTRRGKMWLITHVTLTLIAYFIAALWLLGIYDGLIARFLFIELWWTAVMSGIKLTLATNL